MPGPNTTGTPNTDDYNLGRGIVYISTLVNDLPVDWRDVGNATEFNLTIETEVLEHFSSRSGVRVKDKEVVVSTEVNVSFTLDELNDENKSLFFLGEKGTHTNASIAGFAEHEMITGAVLGRWYDIESSTGARAYDIDSTDLTVEVGANALVLGTDYTLDAEMGRIFLPVTATDGAGGGAGSLAGQDIDVTLAAEATASVVDEVKALTNSGLVAAIKFISVNPAASDARTEYQIHKATIKPEGDFSLIGEEWTTMTLTGACEANETADADSPYLTQRTVRA